MSNIYNLEPKTTGKVILYTTCGDIEIELFCKECPLTCRNFIQLCLEDYYDDTLFFRVVPGFIIQGGDPSNTGEGGQSIYENSFIDEFHSRLKYNRRGLLGMANTGRDSNQSQFFFSLDATPELQVKNTLFGKIEGDTIFNMLKIGEVEVIGDKPLYPVKLLNTKVVFHPFEDLLPRKKILPTITSNNKDNKKKMKRNLALLSFGDDEEKEEETKQFDNIKSSHDVLDDKLLSKKQYQKQEITSEFQSKTKIIQPKQEDKPLRTEVNLDIHPTLNKKAEQQNLVKEQILQLEKELKLMNKSKKVLNIEQEKDIKSNDDDNKKLSGKELLLLQRNKYQSKGKKQGKKNEEQTLRQLKLFQSQLNNTISNNTSDPISIQSNQPCNLHSLLICETCNPSQSINENDESNENWLGHQLKFPKLREGGDKLSDYLVIDPRELAAGPIDKKSRSKR